MSIRATERLYLTAGGALVHENDAAGRTLYCQPGDVISDADLVTYRAYFEAFGWIALAAAKEASVNIASVKMRHDDATGAVTLILPPGSMVQDLFVVCREAAAGSPDVDFGEFGGDTDGLLDGLGQPGICDALTGSIDTSADFKGRGALITSTVNEDSERTKVRKHYASGVTFGNTRNSAGTAGEWTIHVLYLVLPAL